MAWNNTKYAGEFNFGNTVRSYFKSMETKGYWFSFTDETMALPYLSMTLILETMLFPKIGTTTGYIEKDGNIMPEYGSGELKSCAQIEQIQNGAMTFVDDFVEFEPDVRLIQYNDATKAFAQLAFKPTLIQAKTFSNIPFEDGKVYSLASSQPFWYYLFHPVRLLQDYKEARWKEGFIKQVIPFIKTPHRIVLLGRSIKASIGPKFSK